MKSNDQHSPESWRVFIAIELPPDVRRRLTQHINQLRAAVPDVRASWSREQNLHLTMKFLGDTPVANIEKLAQASERAARSSAPIKLVIGGCGAFPPRGQPRVLWIGIEDTSNNLATLQQRLEKECATEGFACESRPFHPHLTIARVRSPHDSRRLAALHQEMGFSAEIVAAAELSVIRSELHREGSRYATISRHAFFI